ncbi:MAG: Hin recombinase [Lachnospiraceae bacterium]|nr:Hin recombinase [Lachnospiraceae bacterium]
MRAAENYGNPRGAGRRPILSEEQLARIKQARAEGETITALAKEYGVSRQTLSGYLNPRRKDGSTCSTIGKWKRLNAEFKNIPVEEYGMRMEFMCDRELCSAILVDFQGQRITVRNHTMDLLHRAFGIREKPGWEDFEEFLESRCFPRTRDQLRLILSDYELDFYDPLTIIEKTQGRMAEDLQWIRILYFRPEKTD